MPRLNATALIDALMWTSAFLFALALALAITFHDAAQGWVTLFGRLSAVLAIAAGGSFFRARVIQARAQARVRVRD